MLASCGQRSRTSGDDPTLGTVGENSESAAAILKKQGPPPVGPTPRTPEGRPDLTGVWHGPLVDPGPDAKMLPWAAQLAKRRVFNKLKDHPEAFCLPANPVPAVTQFLHKVIQTPTVLIMLFERYVPGFQQVFLDGRGHPKDLEPTWLGHSIGKWQGDTLVVDTIGFNGKGWLSYSGHPYTEKLHVIERISRPDLGHLKIDVTLDDPITYVHSWALHKTSELTQNDEVQEYICDENNKDPAHMRGR